MKITRRKLLTTSALLATPATLTMAMSTIREPTKEPTKKPEVITEYITRTEHFSTDDLCEIYIALEMMQVVVKNSIKAQGINGITYAYIEELELANRWVELQKRIPEAAKHWHTFYNKDKT